MWKGKQPNLTTSNGINIQLEKASYQGRNRNKEHGGSEVNSTTKDQIEIKSDGNIRGCLCNYPKRESCYVENKSKTENVKG